MKKAVFFDKDGVINVDKGIDGNVKEAELYPFAADIISYLRSLGFKIFIVTNQPIIARGIITEKDLTESLYNFKQLLLKQNKEAQVDHIYYCPHHPNADIEKYRKKCNCRKPKTGMLKQAEKEFNIDLKSSYIIGDRISDIIAGYLVGCKTILCATGKHNEKMIETDMDIPEDVKPDIIISNISELKDIFLC